MLFGALLASGQITMRRVNGWQTLTERAQHPNLTLARASGRKCNGELGHRQGAKEARRLQGRKLRRRAVCRRARLPGARLRPAPAAKRDGQAHRDDPVNPVSATAALCYQMDRKSGRTQARPEVPGRTRAGEPCGACLSGWRSGCSGPSRRRQPERSGCPTVPKVRRLSTPTTRATRSVRFRWCRAGLKLFPAAAPSHSTATGIARSKYRGGFSTAPTRTQCTR